MGKTGYSWQLIYGGNTSYGNTQATALILSDQTTEVGNRR